MKVLIAAENQQDGFLLIDHAAEHMKPGASFLLMTCVEPEPVEDYALSVYGHDEQRQGLEHRVKEAQENLQKLVEQFKRKTNDEVDLDAQVIIGRAESTIEKMAKDWGADEIIVGSHMRHGLERLFLGSVSEGVCSQAPCSVAVIRNRSTNPSSM